MKILINNTSTSLLIFRLFSEKNYIPNECKPADKPFHMSAKDRIRAALYG